jgi:membrane protein
MSLSTLWSQLRITFSEWNEDDAPRLGASLAFYTLLSLAPLLIVVIGIAGLAFGRAAAQQQVVGQLQQLVGAESAKAIQAILQAQKPSTGLIASIAGFAVLLAGASGVFTELRVALNRIWRVPPKPTQGFMGIVRERLFSFGLVLAVGFLLLVGLVVSAGIAAADKFVRDALPLPAIVFMIVNILVSLGITTFVFALLFKFIPDTHIPWRRVWPGALATAIFFTVGKVLIGLYLGKASVGSAYGAAGSLVVLIVWIYYSAQLFFFGAAFTHVQNQTAA